MAASAIVCGAHRPVADSLVISNPPSTLRCSTAVMNSRCNSTAASTSGRQLQTYRTSATPSRRLSRVHKGMPEPWQQFNLIDLDTDSSQSSDVVLGFVYSGLLECTGLLQPKQKPDQDFHLQFGRAVRSLREDIPNFFQKEGNLDIYTSDVALVDNISRRMGLLPISSRGKESYKRALWSLRFHAMLFLSRSQVEVLRMWSKDDKTVCMRWTVKCRPRLLEGLSGALIYVDGVSEFKFNSQGYIYQHTMDCIDFGGLAFRKKLAKLRHNPAYVPTPNCSFSSEL